MFAADNPFLPQVRLATRWLRLFADEPALALKGGTAINLFYRDLPRLSVDLDFTYLPVQGREQSLIEIAEILNRVAGKTESSLRGVRVRTQDVSRGRLVAQEGRAIVTAEVNLVLRGCVHPSERRSALPAVEDRFGDIDARVLSFDDVYAGKMWKLHNLELYRKGQPARYAQAVADLERVLERFNA